MTTSPFGHPSSRSTSRTTATTRSLITIHIKQTHAPGVASDFTNVVDLAAQHFPLRSHQHDFVLIPDLRESNGRAVPFRSLDADDALPPRPCTRYSFTGVRFP